MAQASLQKLSPPAWEPQLHDPRARIEATTQATLGRWHASATFLWDWSTGAWRVIHYSTRFDDADSADDAVTAPEESVQGVEAPVDDPQESSLR